MRRVVVRVRDKMQANYRYELAEPWSAPLGLDRWAVRD